MPLAARLLALTLAFAPVGCGCSGEEQAGSGSGGAGGSAASAGTGAVASGGSGGSTLKDSGSDAPASGPKWMPIPGELYGCSFERLANPGEFQAFTWKPCEGTPGCEQAVFDSSIWFESTDWLHESALVVTALNDDGATTRASVVVNRIGDPLLIFIVSQDGRTLDGFRTNKPVSQCAASASVWSKHMGVYLADDQVENFGLMLGDVGQSQAPKLVPLMGHPPGNPQDLVMGTSRWLFWWVLPHQLVTVSNVDGSDLRIVAKSDPQNGPIGELGQPVSAGDYFLYHQWVDNTSAPGTHWEIAITDGVSAGKPYLVPPLGDSYASPVYADSHVAWMHGINMKGVNVYDSVEVWASPWSPDSAKLKPAKVGDFPLSSTAQGVGGWGHYLTPTSVHDVLLWDLAKGTSRKLLPPSNMAAFWRPSGITRKHLWTSARDDPTVNRGDYLLRYTLDP